MPSNSSNNTSSKAHKGSGGNGPPSKYRTAKDGWGSKHGFMTSYGLKTYSPEDHEEANAILDAFQELDAKASRQGSSGK